MKTIFPAVLSLLLFSLVVSAQETPLQPPATTMPERPPVGTPGMMTPMPRMNPAMLLRMRDQMTFELQQTQRTLGIIDPSDTQLTATLKEQQTELLNQLKDINAQLQAAGFPAEGEAASGGLPNLPKANDPTLVSGGMHQLPADPNLLIQQRQPGMPTMPPGFQMMNPMMPPSPVGQPAPTRQPSLSPATPPTAFDQEQAWTDSPWTPRPSKELGELKQTVDALRKELGEMKETVKALETQIQLLNRNFLLHQQTPGNPKP